MKQRILLKDDFIGTNSTALTSHYPDKLYLPHSTGGTTWATLTGHTIPQIQSNSASATGDATNNSAVVDLNRAHVKIEANITAGTTSGATNWVAFLLRLVDVNNYIQVKMGETSSASFNLQINKVVGGSATTLATRSVTFADATSYNLTVRCTGNLVYATYDDGGADLQHSIIGDWLPGTWYGIWMYVAATSTTYPLVNNITIWG